MLSDEYKNSIVQLVIEVWRIKDKQTLLETASQVSFANQGKIEYIFQTHKKAIINPREAIDDTKAELIDSLTTHRLTTLPTAAHNYPRNAIEELLMRKKAETPRPPKADPFHGRL